MTELNDHLKLLYARLGTLYCRGCGKPVQRDNAESIRRQLERDTQKTDPRLTITFPIAVPANFPEDAVRGFLEQTGHTRIHHEETIARVAAPLPTTTAPKKNHQTNERKRAA